MNSYDLSRNWFDWCFENPEKISPNHTAMYFFIIEHCNRMGWKEKFGLPSTMVKDAIGIKSYNTYIKTLNDLVDWGFIVIVPKSKNQYSSNIIALSKKAKAGVKALDKALSKHSTRQVKSNDSIDKQTNKEQETISPNDQEKHRLVVWLEKNCPLVMKLESPITNKQAESILEEYPNARDVGSLFSDMQNYKDLLKKFTSANLTFRQWARKRVSQNPSWGQVNHDKQPQPFSYL